MDEDTLAAAIGSTCGGRVRKKSVAFRVVWVNGYCAHRSLEEAYVASADLPTT
jgi:hypothetical protein